MITLSGGLAYFYGIGFLVESTMLIGNNKHFFEPGIMGFCFFDLSTGTVLKAYDTDLIEVAVRTGYRYQGPKGLLFRVAPLFYFCDGEFSILPALSLGYSF